MLVAFVLLAVLPLLLIRWLFVGFVDGCIKWVELGEKLGEEYAACAAVFDGGDVNNFVW